MSDSDLKLLIVESRFYPDIADALRTGATRAAETVGADVECVTVPGALELPAAIKVAHASQTESYDGFVALGCVIRGETSHYDIVCVESARALQELAIGEALAIGNGILTVDSRDQAWARAHPDGKDKGGDALRACLAMVMLKRRYQVR